MRLGIGLVFAVVLTACTEALSDSCNLIGCTDSVNIEAAFSDHVWPVGAYHLELTLNELQRVCTFSIPVAFPAQGSSTHVACEPADPQLEVSMRQAATCRETRADDAVSQSCDRIDGQYDLRIDVFGAPRRLQLRLERDAVLVSQHDLALSYVELRPNGPECEPLCRQSSLALQLD